jgi:hypothetical protein
MVVGVKQASHALVCKHMIHHIIIYSFVRTINYCVASSDMWLSHLIFDLFESSNYCDVINFRSRNATLTLKDVSQLVDLQRHPKFASRLIRDKRICELPYSYL